MVFLLVSFIQVRLHPLLQAPTSCLRLWVCVHVQSVTVLLDIFDCTYTGNEDYIQTSDRSRTCYSSEWSSLLAFALVFLVPYCAGTIMLLRWIASRYRVREAGGGVAARLTTVFVAAGR